MKKSLVYTKTGDKGTTSLIGGTRVPKHHLRLEAYGTIDELNSFLGMIRSYDVEETVVNSLVDIQRILFVIGAYLATDTEASDLRDRLKCDEDQIFYLENEMDRMERTLPPLTNFLLPGGNPVVSSCHIARTICRRAERRVNEMHESMEINDWVLRYLNRLSDYLFVLSRFLSNQLKVTEIPWVPKL